MFNSAHFRHRVVFHNLGHHDLYFKTQTLDDQEGGWCKPRGQVRVLAQHIMDHLTRSSSSMTLDGSALNLAEPLEIQPDQLNLEWPPQADVPRSNRLLITQIHMPLVDAILRSHEYTHKNQQEIQPYPLHFLILSGGTPSDKGNTEGFGQILLTLIKKRWAQLHPDHTRHYQVDHLHLDCDVYQITPSSLLIAEDVVRQKATKLAQTYKEEWQSYLQVYLSANTGTPMILSALSLVFSPWKARLQTLNSARNFPLESPDSPKHKRFPKTQEISQINDWISIEFDHLNQASQLAVQSLRQWRAEYLTHKPKRPNEIESKSDYYFHRKGKKEVLAVLIVKDSMGVEGVRNHLCAIRGINLEVSLPTGSLCAERNAIGSALVRFPQLKREDLQAVAVLSLDSVLCENGPLGPCGSCDEWLKKMLEMNPNLQVIGFGDTQAESIYIRPFSI